jgi:hypothetical protein
MAVSTISFYTNLAKCTVPVTRLKAIRLHTVYNTKRTREIFAAKTNTTPETVEALIKQNNFAAGAPIGIFTVIEFKDGLTYYAPLVLDCEEKAAAYQVKETTRQVKNLANQSESAGDYAFSRSVFYVLSAPYESAYIIFRVIQAAIDAQTRSLPSVDCDSVIYFE